jgi:hypothetical protein
MTICVRESGMPMTVSRNSPSTNVLPSTSRPSPTKNPVTRSRSSTVMPTRSKQPQSWNPPNLKVVRGMASLSRHYDAARCCAHERIASDPEATVPTAPERVGVATACLPGLRLSGDMP